MPPLRIEDHTRDRYHSLAISSVWDLSRIRKATALVVGAGALGNEVCKNLAMMGVRLIAIADRDTVEMANLTRSIFFREADHGRMKTEVIAERIADVNPDVEVMQLSGDLDETIGLGLVRRVDMVFSCLDSRIARRSLNRMCERLQKPWIDGAMEDLLGEVAVFVPDEGPCYECNFTLIDKQIVAQATSCRGIALRALVAGRVPTVSTMGSIVAAIQVQEGLKLLHGRAGMAGRKLSINCGLNDFLISSVARKADCEGHFRYGEIVEEPAFSAARTTARELLQRYRADTGSDGYIELGRETVMALQCGTCGSYENLLVPALTVSEDVARCPTCAGIRVPLTIHVIQAEDEYADQPLAHFCVPALDVVEVRGPGDFRWYELSGDIATLPTALRSMSPALV